MAISTLLPACFAIAAILFVANHITIYLCDSRRLRKYPTLSPLCGVTNLAYIYEVWRSDSFRTRALSRAHIENEVIRIGPTALSFSSVHAIKDIYGHNTPCLKGDMYSTAAGPHRSLLDCIDKQEHSAKRKRLAAAFATKNLETWEHKIVDKCSRLMARFDAHCASDYGAESGAGDQMIDFRKWSNIFTVEAIADIALSEHLGLLEAGEDTVVALDEKGNRQRVPFIKSLHGLGRMAAPIVWSSAGYPVLKNLFRCLSRAYAEAVKNNSSFDNIVRRMTACRFQRYKAGEDVDDFFSCLVEDKHGKETDFAMGEIMAEVAVFMNAGSDTTAIALTHALYYILKNPDKLDRLREELDQSLDPSDMIPAYAVVKNVAYLRACIDESLRLSPPVSFGLQRKTPPGGTFINGEWIAGDTSVSVPAYIAHRDPSIFPDPEKFLPERWLTKESKAVQKYFIPFSTGARGCIGRNISYIEQHVLLSALLRRYEFALPYPEWELQWEERFNLWPSAMPLRVWRRST